MGSLMDWVEAHPLITWVVGTSVANALTHLCKRRDTPIGRFLSATGVDLRRALGDKPGAKLPALLVAVSLGTNQACGWFRGDTGATTIATPYGSVTRKGAYVPDPAPSTFVTVYCGTDGGAAVYEGGSADARGE